MKQLKLRPVQKSDIELIFKWSNDEEVRKNSFHTEAIKWEEHVKWFKKVLQNNAVLFWILTDRHENIGQIRLDFENKNEAIITYDIDKEYRFKGYGKEILRLAEETLRGNFINEITLYAFVKNENRSSQIVFEKMNYKTIEKNNNFIKYCKII